ncbi:hypothetical protein A1A1_15378 [Planococcus antarcticus DSM 14505]|uniref:Uncharacterized protein n=1 Tax=Planococcus antarcticus DSM 14505 TaxID=1185653 RepID=A0A1C7DH36_9BACL|nr:hypothetical protein [Planococcus antarcticus]ANU10816.1 hypothetical protein BBH88_11095 [Planococcus antarcticus DSM 14505]EIM05596.1 hypothetical protein A1A1_15378 [Planococcus antarcticus DSM 14505]
MRERKLEKLKEKLMMGLKIEGEEYVKKILIMKMLVFIFVEAFEEEKTTTDRKKIAAVRGILNKASHLNAEYKIATEPRYKIQLIYKDRSTEVIDVIEEFGKNKTLLSSDKNEYYEINDK